MDPALRELAWQQGEPDDEVAVLLRLRDPGVPPAGVRVVADFGEVVTARVARGAIPDVWADTATASVKASYYYTPDIEPADAEAEPEDAADTHRPPGLVATGKGVVVGVVDWGCDVAHPDFRLADGSTRLLGLWDQRPGDGMPPAPYGYGRAFGPAEIDAALRTADPYAALGYHPADFDSGFGAHGTHTLSIAAGNGRAGGPQGMAPEADCVFVGLGRREGAGAVPLGSSVELLEALDHVGQVAGDRPLAVNLSLGRHAGEHTGRTLVEQAMDAFVTTRLGRAVVQSCGNYFERRTHGFWQVHAGDRQRFTIEVDPGDRTPNEVDIWYPGRDRMTLVVACPELDLRATVRRGSSATLSAGGVDVARIYHRAHDPNNGDNQGVIRLEPHPAARRWEVTVVGDDVVDGRVHAWVERDSGCRLCQSRLAAEQAVQQSTTGTIANGFRTLVVGAYDAHREARPLARFSSSGPTRDGRQKPDLVAPGVMVLGARSAPLHGAAPSRYVRMSGTSMAAPAVTGAVALLLQKGGRLPIEDLRRILLASCAPLPEGADPRRAGAGMLDVEAALALVEDSGDVAEELQQAVAATEAPATVETAGVEAALVRAPRDVRVAVVGGGLSGLMAAHSLAGARFQVTVFEAGDRIGGRVWSRTDLVPGTVVEAGAELIGSNHPRWLLLARAFGLRLTDVTSEQDYQRRGLRVRWRLGSTDLSRSDKERIRTELAPVLARIGQEAATVDRLRPWTSPGAAAWDTISVADRLRRPDLFGSRRSQALAYLEFQLGNDQCAPTSRQSYLGLLAAVSAHRVGSDLLGYWKHTEDHRCAGGNQRLATELARTVPDLRLGAPVRTVELIDRGVRVAYEQGRACHAEDFDVVVLAGAPQAWPAVVSDPAFAPGDRTMSSGPAVKHLGAVDSRFWERRGLAPSAMWDGIGSVWESADGQPRSRDSGLSVYSGGPYVLSGPDYPARLEVLYPGYRGHVGRQELVDWPAQPWVGTGYSVPAPGEVTTIARNLSRPFRGRVFFAGEQASPGFFGYMEGALDAGVRAAWQVVAAARARSALPAPARAPRAPSPRAAPTQGSRSQERGASEDMPTAAPVALAAAGGGPGAGLAVLDRLPTGLLDPAPDDVEAAPCQPAPEHGRTGPGSRPTLRRPITRPVVGYAQQCLNAFLVRHQSGSLPCTATSPEAGAFVDRTVAALRTAGQLPLAVDCAFGSNTERAVKALQACHGLDRDGVVGPLTWPLLEQYAPTAGSAYQLLVDTTRSGTLAPATPGWRWGAAGTGPVLLVNNDDDGISGRPDNADAVVNAGNDRAELAPLSIVLNRPPDPGTTLELEVSDPASLRVFASASAGAAEIIGPGSGAVHRFAVAPASRLDLVMEGVRYARRGFPGEVTLTLRATSPARAPEEQTVTVRVAPWIVHHHLDRPQVVHVVDAGSDNSRFRAELRQLVTAAGCRLVEFPQPGDIWMQDCMEFGYASVPGRALSTALRAPRARPLRSYPRRLLAPDLGYVEEGTLGVDTTFDSTGNLEASPPVTVRGKRYPFGRIYYGAGRPGDELDPLVRDFLRAQVVQEPIELDTNWLTVGHVDEVVSFVPAPGEKGFRLLLASPRRAYQLLDGLAVGQGGATMLSGRSLRVEHPSPGRATVERTVREFLALRDDFNPELRALVADGLVSHTSTSLREYNARRQADIDRMRGLLLAELGLVDADVVEIPAVFMPNPTAPTLADALVPGMVNMLVLGRSCIVPKPFGPVVRGDDVFERAVRDELDPLGLTVSFLDCWEEYHVLLGEVHCATNTLRAAVPAPWWEFTP